MTRPLVITDCDEVLMHMVVPFAQWVDEEHGVIFRMEDTSFAGALKRKECGTPLEAAEVWPLLDGFFRTEMPRQYPIPGALSAMAEIARHADIVVLTNVGPDHQAARMAQLAALGLDAEGTGPLEHLGLGQPFDGVLDEGVRSGEFRRRIGVLVVRLFAVRLFAVRLFAAVHPHVVPGARGENRTHTPP